ncbi:acyl-CoA dehydrogenase family protein [Methyloraptor flagellatus]|uniref:Acyl-CoA dehydrogenase family protein n=1 Tax=Methyloraptor flagellatus TaxID=3162530 RepID=A0AAU7XFL4_9HYPH
METNITAEAADSRMRRVAAEVAAKAADAVDKEGRFPTETFDALKRERLLGVMIPPEFGGEGLSVGEVAELCAILGGACGSSALIYAMHNIKVSSFVTHGRDSAWHRDYMRKIAEDQLLIGSATTEYGIGGDLRNSICAVEVQGDRFTLTKEANCISYGLQSDAILVTCRRSPEAASSDQVMVCVRREDCTLDQTTTWDTLGMRGTNSVGFTLKSAGNAAQIFPHPFSEIAAQSMLSMTHILWAGAWYGIAADAVARAQAFVKAAAKKTPGQLPPGALRLAEVVAMLQEMKGCVNARIERYEAVKDDADALSSMSFAADINNLKISASELGMRVVEHALLITGLPGYRNDTPFSVARHMRDILSARIMISNDRILSNTSNLLLAGRFDKSLRS